MLLRASNAVGYTAYPDNVVREFIYEAAAQGIDIFRIFDSLNWMPNMQVAVEAALKTGRLCEAAICYTGDILDPAREKYSLHYYVRLAKELQRMGTHILAIKDMAGLLRPYAAYKLVKTLREEVGVPIHLHTHDTSGINAATILKAAEAGVDVADAAISAMSGATSQPNLNSIVAALAHTERDTASTSTRLTNVPIIGKTVRTYYTPFDNAPKSGMAEVYIHEMPGGQYTNLKEQAEAMGLGGRWPEIARMYADVNMAFGDIVKVTPSSKVVGDLAIYPGQPRHDRATIWKSCRPIINLTLPNSVVDMFMGSLGEPEGGWPPKLQQVILRGKKPIMGRPGATPRPGRPGKGRGARSQNKPEQQPDRCDELSDVSGRLFEICRGPREIWRVRCPADTAIFLWPGTRRGSRHRARTRQDAVHSIIDGGRARIRMECARSFSN